MACSKYCKGGWDLGGLLRVFWSWFCLASSFHTPCTYTHQDPTPLRYTALSSSPKPCWSLKWKCQFRVWGMFYFKMKHKSRHCPWRQNFPFVGSIIVLGESVPGFEDLVANCTGKVHIKMNFNVSPHLRPVCHSFSTALATVLRSRTIVDSLNHSLQCQIKL